MQTRCNIIYTAIGSFTETSTSYLERLMVQSSPFALFPLCERVINTPLFDAVQVPESVVIYHIIMVINQRQLKPEVQ